MNGSESDWPTCAGDWCKVQMCYALDSSHSHPKMTGKSWRGKWYCDSCWEVMWGKALIEKLERENASLKKRVTWFEKLMRPGLLARLFRRLSMRRSYAERMEDGLKTILSHAGSATECVDEPGKGYLREICEIVDDVYGTDTGEED